MQGQNSGFEAGWCLHVETPFLSVLRSLSLTSNHQILNGMWSRKDAINVQIPFSRRQVSIFLLHSDPQEYIRVDGETRAMQNQMLYSITQKTKFQMYLLASSIT